jgi:hypothetical protein
MSIPKDATGRFIVDKEKLIDNYVLLMSDFYNWAVKYGPSKLVRKPSKKKKEIALCANCGHPKHKPRGCEWMIGGNEGDPR